jgi:hypothetical protein
MSSKGHNKKRNAGLLYEFLVRTISTALVEGNQKKSAVALKILRKHFKPGSELYREFRLVNSLIKTKVTSEAVAANILNEARSAARSHDIQTLDREKSLLIKHINYSIKDDNFYDQQINEYRMYATVQTLLNDWRSTDKDLSRMATYEDQLVQWLVSERPEADDHVISEESNGTARLLMKVMTKKLNEKYAGVLNDDQKSLVKAYVFSAAHDDPTVIHKKLAEIKSDLLQRMDEYTAANANKYVNEKLNEARERLISETLDVVNDETVTRFMLYTKLSTELNGEE